MSETFFKKTARIAGVMGLLAGAGQVTKHEAPSIHRVEKSSKYFDQPDFFRRVPNGEFSKTERARRKEQLSGGEWILHDIGLDFYIVQEDDTTDSIRERLARYSRYAYLSDQEGKLHSFNIPSDSLEAGMPIPVPWPDEQREMTDAFFIQEATIGIKEMSTHHEYGEAVKRMIQKAGGIPMLVAAMLAVAKQESGGSPLGQFEFHRYEPAESHRVFSFSIFHVLMEGPGLRARRTLHLTEGQVYHPCNATKLFLGFMIEKCEEMKNEPEDFFPLDKHLEDFASFYNGSGWRRTNPDYADQIEEYYDEALSMIKKKEKKK